MSTQARHSVALTQIGPEVASFHCVHVGRADEFVYRLDQQIAASRIPYHVELRPSVGGRPIVVASAAPAHVPALQRAIEAAGASAWPVRPADDAAERRWRTTKREVRKRSEAEVLAEYPMAGLLPGWYVRVRETSNQAWLAEGTDRWGHEVSCRVEEGEIQPCVEMAMRVQRELDSLSAR